MPRVRIAPGRRHGEAVTLPKAEAHYVSHVLRLRPGDEIDAFDGHQHTYRLRLTTVSSTTVQGRVVIAQALAAEAVVPLVLGQAMPKGTKMDLVVEKCSELGLTTLVPLYTERTAVRDVAGRWRQRLARWQRIAEAAARQCGRRTLLEMQGPMSLSDFWAHYRVASVKIMCWEQERRQGLRSLLASHTGLQPVVVLIGPEGGWTPQEVAQTRTHGFVTVYLGPCILRTETAAIAVTSMIRYGLGGFEPPGEGYENDVEDAT
ncbi:Ribosomal RNA small subunit methyltransferase E [Candidatus Entotheonellaceae bacterium PAL068K]